MSAGSGTSGCGAPEQLAGYALQVLAEDEAAAVAKHLAGCAACRDEVESLRPVIDALVEWPTDVLRPGASLWGRLADRVAAETGTEPATPESPPWREPDWEEVAPGISCKLLATDGERHRVSMLVKLAPGVAYPPHRHAGLEELHLLEGELMIGDRKLCPGDYNRGLTGTEDHFVWSATGCTCVLIASTRDELR